MKTVTYLLHREIGSYYQSINISHQKMNT